MYNVWTAVNVQNLNDSRTTRMWNLFIMIQGIAAGSIERMVLWLE
jgi:hypothetical protein